jgi:hypothetical protein
MLSRVDSAPLLRGGPPPEPPAHRAAAEPAQPRPVPRATSWISAAAPEHGAGFMIQQLLAARPELGGAPANRQKTIAAYQTHLAARIHYSGPVTPVDLRI